MNITITPFENQTPPAKFPCFKKWVGNPKDSNLVVMFVNNTTGIVVSGPEYRINGVESNFVEFDNKEWVDWHGTVEFSTLDC